MGNLFIFDSISFCSLQNTFVWSTVKMCYCHKTSKLQFSNQGVDVDLDFNFVDGVIWMILKNIMFFRAGIISGLKSSR